MGWKQKIIFLISLGIIFWWAALTPVQATELEYPIPFPGGGSLSETQNPGEYVRSLFRFGIGAAGILAVAAIVVGGFLYMTSAGNESKVGRSKEIIWGAILGLLLLLCSYLILYTIDEDLIDLDIGVQNTSGGDTTVVDTTTDGNNGNNGSAGNNNPYSCPEGCTPTGFDTTSGQVICSCP